MTEYNPQLSALLDEVYDDWGDPETNRKNLVPFGIKPIDNAVYGIDVVNGGVYVIMGRQKGRKTTLALNIIVNINMYDRLAAKPTINIDTLESGMHPKRYRDALISIVATKHLLKQGHKVRSCPACGTLKCRQIGITPEFLRYKTRTKEQLAAIEYAIDTMRSWPVLIHGANPYQGDTRNLKAAVRDKASRWVRLIEEHGVKINIIDHVQQYYWTDEPSDYEKQLRGIAAISDIAAQYQQVEIVLSQVSLSSLKSAQSGAGKINAAGGTKAQQEAQLSLSSDYVPGSGEVKVTIEESRVSNTFSVWQPIEDESGAFYGEARVHNGAAVEQGNGRVVNEEKPY